MAELKLCVSMIFFVPFLYIYIATNKCCTWSVYYSHLMPALNHAISSSSYLCYRCAWPRCCPTLNCSLFLVGMSIGDEYNHLPKINTKYCYLPEIHVLCTLYFYIHYLMKSNLGGVNIDLREGSKN